MKLREAAFLIILIVGGVAFVNEGGPQCVKEHGVKECAKRVTIEPVDYSKLNS